MELDVGKLEVGKLEVGKLEVGEPLPGRSRPIFEVREKESRSKTIRDEVSMTTSQR